MRESGYCLISQSAITISLSLCVLDLPVTVPVPVLVIVLAVRKDLVNVVDNKNEASEVPVSFIVFSILPVLCVCVLYLS